MTPQQEIKAWLESGRDYSAGIALLQRYGKNKILAAGLAKAGKERMEQNHKKLAYELGKLAGSSQLVVSIEKPVASRQLPVTSHQQQFGPKTSGQNLQPDTEASGLNFEHDPEVSGLNSSFAYPQPIRRLKMEYGELYNRRSMLHRLMREVPEENSPANMEKRASLFAEISQATDRIEVLYFAQEKWIRLGTIPDEKELWPEAPPPIAIGVTNELPDDIESLKKLKKNLQTNNVKDRNLLEFQGRTKGDDAQPMPDGPKRKLIEKRIKEREEMIVKVDFKLQECYLNHQK